MIKIIQDRTFYILKVECYMLNSDSYRLLILVATFVEWFWALSNLLLCCLQGGSKRIDLRLEELRHHLHIESAVSDGARNVIRILQNTKSADKKQQSEVNTHAHLFVSLIRKYINSCIPLYPLIFFIISQRLNRVGQPMSASSIQCSHYSPMACLLITIC